MRGETLIKKKKGSEVVGIKSRTLHKLGKRSTTEPTPGPAAYVKLWVGSVDIFILDK